MPSLLDLPREIRDTILGFVLFTPPRTPPDFSCYDHRRRGLTIAFHGPQRLICFCNLVKVLPIDIQYNVFFTTRASLLLQNHQLNVETLSLLQRKHPSTTQYVLYVGVVIGLDLWPA